MQDRQIHERRVAPPRLTRTAPCSGFPLREFDRAEARGCGGRPRCLGRASTRGRTRRLPAQPGCSARRPPPPDAMPRLRTGHDRPSPTDGRSRAAARSRARAVSTSSLRSQASPGGARIRPLSPAPTRRRRDHHQAPWCRHPGRCSSMAEDSTPAPQPRTILFPVRRREGTAPSRRVGHDPSGADASGGRGRTRAIWRANTAGSDVGSAQTRRLQT